MLFIQPAGRWAEVGCTAHPLARRVGWVRKGGGTLGCSYRVIERVLDHFHRDRAAIFRQDRFMLRKCLAVGTVSIYRVKV